MRREHGQRRKASHRPEKNAGSVFEQREALARIRAHLRDEVRNRAGRAANGWLKRLSDLTVFSSQARTHSNIVLQHPTRPISPAEIQIHFSTDEKKPVFSDRFLKMVGERGFEPPTHWSQTSCATKLRYSPIFLTVLPGAKRGT